MQEVLKMFWIEVQLTLLKTVSNSAMILRDAMSIPGMMPPHHFLGVVFCMNHVKRRFPVLVVLQVESIVSPLHTVTSTKS